MFTQRYNHAKLLTLFTIDILSEYAHQESFDTKTKGKKVLNNQQTQVVNGCVYVLIRLVAFILKDPNYSSKLLWDIETTIGLQKVPYAFKLIDAIMILLFKYGYTVRYPESDILSQASTAFSLDEDLVWSTGLATLGNIQNSV